MGYFEIFFTFKETWIMKVLKVALKKYKRRIIRFEADELSIVINNL